MSDKELAVQLYLGVIKAQCRVLAAATANLKQETAFKVPTTKEIAKSIKELTQELKALD